MNRRALLLILDGWGIAPAGKGNAISRAETPNFDMLWSKFPHTTLAASGKAVGLPEGQIGNSEVGHSNIGAGRVVWQDLPRISNSIKDGTFFENKFLKDAFEYAKSEKKRIHLIGLVSPGGVHSHQEHFYALLEMAKENKVHDVYIHAFTDGRDVAPQSALAYIEKLEKYEKKVGIGKIATVTGRYYAMDRDKRWDRVSLAYNALVLGRGEIFQSASEAVKKSYQRDIDDEFIKPSIIDPSGMIDNGDVIIFVNFRSDRTRELTKSLISVNFDSFKRGKVASDLHFLTMTEYEKDLPVKVIFPLEEVKNTLGEVVSSHNLTQFHLAETEKYAHVTFFFDGGREEPSVGEDRVMIPSLKVATYDQKPGMSAIEVTEELISRLSGGKYDFVVVNYANLDMVGHTGKIPATIAAAETVDNCLGRVVSAAIQNGYQVIVTADHGNAEKMLNTDGSVCTAHSTNEVPFILISDEYQSLRKLSSPAISDIAPTVLKLLKIEKPTEMTSKSLV